MICQRMKATARMAGVGLIAVTMTASTALAQKVTCPFTSKDIDGWYKDIGFDTGADDAGGANVVCALGSYGTYATLDEVELAETTKEFNGTPVSALQTSKHILVDVQKTGGYQGAPKYTIELVRDGTALADPKMVANAPLSVDEYEACVSALTSSQAWKRWACGKQ